MDNLSNNLSATQHTMDGIALGLPQIQNDVAQMRTLSLNTEQSISDVARTLPYIQSTMSQIHNSSTTNENSILGVSNTTLETVDRNAEKHAAILQEFQEIQVIN